MHFVFIFSEYSRLLFPKRLWKWASTISFRKYQREIVLFVIYFFNYDSSESTFFMLNMSFDVLILMFWVHFLLYKLEFFVCCNNIITRTSFLLLCEHVYMRPEVNSNRFEISNCFEMSFRLYGNLHGDFTAATFQSIGRPYCKCANDIF